MRNGDGYAIGALGISPYDLMGRAAFEVYGRMTEFVQSKSKKSCGNVVILCGKGNNGGDGYAVGKLLCRDYERSGSKVICVDVFGCKPTSDEACRYREQFEENGGVILSFTDAESLDRVHEYIKKADVLVDAVFGTGFCGGISPDSPVGKIILDANSADGIKIAIDCPSGVNCLTGAVSEVTFEAQLTVTLSRAKPGLYSYPAKELCGKVIVSDIGIPDGAYPEKHSFEIIDRDYIRSLMKPRSVNSHKGVFGRLMCLCGSGNMTGAAALCISGALRSGAGLVNAVSTKEVLDVLKIKFNEPIFTDLCDTAAFEKSLTSAHAVVMGCGLSRSDKTDGIVYDITRSYKKQIIIDADGINAISENINVLEKAYMPPILTPHPLEFSRLSGLSMDEIMADRIGCAKDFAARHRCIVVLKGAATVITDGTFTAVNTTGNSGLAKGGSGDVLAGIISSLCVQGYDAFSAAAIGVYVHGRAAEVLADTLYEYGMLPSDIAVQAGIELGTLCRREKV